ncbi:MAG: hypothetical protein H6578_03095 [Chitinophagales bacterium]|nr:hypothetical protein [Chitinophagales bacterium]
MNKIFALFTVALLLFSCNTSSNSDNNGNSNVEVTERVTSKNQLFLDLIRPETSGMFRGIEFDMSKDEVKKIETSRGNVTIYRDETPEELIVTTDMGRNKSNFADITYSFDGQGLYSVTVESYTDTKENALEVFNEVKKYFTNKYGTPYEAEDGFSEYTIDGANKKYMIAVKNIDNVEDSFGMYIYIDITE